MDAVRETENEKTFEIYFGGTYTECWSEDYSLAIRYSSRRSVTARRMDGAWRAVGGDGTQSAAHPVAEALDALLASVSNSDTGGDP